MHATLQPDRPTANCYVTDALSAYNVFGSFTPGTFAAKWPHVAGERIAIVFEDILRATTTLTAALACGCRGIYLAVKTPGDAYDDTPPTLPHESWLLGGEENGRPIAGGAFDNSPPSVINTDLAGKYVKFYSTNGARALQAILQAFNAEIFLMCLANVAVTMAAVARGEFTAVWFVNGGFYGSPCLEDVVAAGRAIACLIDDHGVSAEALDDEALIMRDQAHRFASDDALLIALKGRQVPRLLAGLDKSGDVACAVTGDGLGAVWDHMSRTVVRVVYTNGVPLLVPKL